MARRRSIWNRRSGGVKAYRHVVGLGAAAGAFLVAAVTPLTAAPTANADIVGPVINTGSGLALFEPGANGGDGGNGTGGQGGAGGHGGAGGKGGAGGSGGAGGTRGAPGQPGQPGQPGG